MKPKMLNVLWKTTTTNLCCYHCWLCDASPSSIHQDKSDGSVVGCYSSHIQHQWVQKEKVVADISTVLVEWTNVGSSETWMLPCLIEWDSMLQVVVAVRDRGDRNELRSLVIRRRNSKWDTSSFSRVQLFVTPWTRARQALLSSTASRSCVKFMLVASMTLSNHLILCHPLLLLPLHFPNIRVFSRESSLLMRWPKYWSLSFKICPSTEHSGLISFMMDRFVLLAVQGALESLL